MLTPRAGSRPRDRSHLDEGDGSGGALDVQQDGAHLRRHRQHAHGGGGEARRRPLRPAAARGAGPARIAGGECGSDGAPLPGSVAPAVPAPGEPAPPPPERACTLCAPPFPPPSAGDRDCDPRGRKGAGSTERVGMTAAPAPEPPPRPAGTGARRDPSAGACCSPAGSR